MATPLQAQDADIFYLLLSGYLVFFMQCGFAMLSSGSVRSKNAMNIILKNLLDACFGALGWFFLGYAIAYGNGDGTNSFIAGRKHYALSEANEQTEGNEGIFADWFFQYAFAATAATIVSGAVAERTRFEAYLAYAFLLTAWVYPVIVHWVWDPNGWLNFGQDKIGDIGHGLVDFAGCGVVHMTGGFAGMWGALFVGPRMGRFNHDGEPQPIPGHNASLAILGVFILWFGWFGFNPGSTLALAGAGLTASRCAVTTTLCAASATITTLVILMVINYIQTGELVWDLIGTANGTLGGLVGITASCAVVQPWVAVVIGIISGFVYVAASNFVLRVLGIDDPLDAVAVHGFCGIWGLIATAAFAHGPLMAEAGFGYGEIEGFIMGGDGGMLAVAFVAIMVIFVWVTVFMAPFFFVMKLLGLLRVKPEEELAGLDKSHHGGSAYPGEEKALVDVDMIASLETRIKEDGERIGNLETRLKLLERARA
eukprot:TRINITY_DN534_c0_g1_i4.p1 TRINITY_DN534_c0_g1~~TRINITY_DN534_c0_g1_i4.p1  ORF type:complete len:545 (+),score=79.52 TRINITY_DN534_c0_g1_i4:191-1636(+)